MTIKACFPIYTCICIERIERTFFYFNWKGKRKYRHISVLKRARNQNLDIRQCNNRQYQWKEVENRQ